MNKGMVRCRECGLWFFNWRKLYDHLINEHGYVIELAKGEGEQDES